MEYAYSIIMFAMGGLLLIYSLILKSSKDVKLIPRDWAASMKNKKKYATDFAKIIMLISIFFIISGILGLLSRSMIFVAVVVLIVGIIGSLVYASKLMEKQYKK